LFLETGSTETNVNVPILSSLALPGKIIPLVFFFASPWYFLLYVIASGDDFYGFLDDNERISNSRGYPLIYLWVLSAIGRDPAKNKET